MALEERGDKNNGTGILLVLVATVALSTEAVAAKIAFAQGANILSTLAVRYIIAACCFSACLLVRGLVLPSLTDLTRIALLGIGAQASTVLLLFHSFYYLPAALAILFLYLYPAFTTILSRLFLKEPFTWRKATALLLTLGGCAVILGFPAGDIDPRGVILAAGAALTNAVFLVGSAGLLSQVHVPVYNTYMSITLALFFTVLGLATNRLQLDHEPGTWLTLLVLGLVCTVLALTALFHGVKRIGASRAAIVSTLEPLFTAILGTLLLGEYLETWQLTGGILILAGVILQRR